MSRNPRNNTRTHRRGEQRREPKFQEAKIFWFSFETRRFLRDYTSGELNYILWKHVQVLGFIHDMLELYYNVTRGLTLPKPGPL